MATPFSKLALLYAKLEKTSSYLRKRDELTRFFRQLRRDEVKVASYLTLGTVGASYEGNDLGIAEKMAIRAVSDAYSVPEKEVKKRLNKAGDLGDVVYDLSKKKKSNVSIRDVYRQLNRIKEASGEESQKTKITALSGLLKRASSLEAKYITRIVLRALRMGIGEQTLMDAFAIAFAGGIKNKPILEDSYNKCTDIGALGESFAKNGLSASKKFSIEIGRPVKAMLAQRVGKVSDILEKMETDEIAAEEKYDGERLQIHKDGNNVRAFSRRLNDVTEQFPEIIDAVKKHVKAERVVLDGEVVAFEKGKIRPFQVLMHRRRKYEIERYRKEIPVAIFFFDILYLNGNSLLKKGYAVRRKHLKKVIQESKRIRIAKQIMSADFKKIRKFFRESVKKGLEGILVKSTAEDSHYEPGKRGWLWIKWKKEYAEGMRETFDLVVVGSYYGKGLRKDYFGALLCAAYNKKRKRFETFTKVGTGYTDEDYMELKKILNKHKIKDRPGNLAVRKAMKPDIYYEPELVVEVLGAEITRSSAHTAGKDGNKGLALRFPRFLRIRRDKRPEDATTVDEIKAIKNA